MSNYTTRKTASKTDRIERAVAIIEDGRIWTQANGVFRVFSDRMNNAYTVTVDSCDCHDFTENLKGESPCKHLWAAIGATAAMLIHAIRSAESTAALEAIGKAYAAAMQTLPAAYVTAARNEYRRRFELLAREDAKPATTQAPQPKPATASKPRREEEDGAILRKPQPKSVKYNGWEI